LADIQSPCRVIFKRRRSGLRRFIGWERTKSLMAITEGCEDPDDPSAEVLRAACVLAQRKPTWGSPDTDNPGEEDF